MMKLKSVSGVTCYVRNVAKSTAFYESIGFNIKRKEPKRATAYLNWFWIDLISIRADSRPAYRTDEEIWMGCGPLVYISVDNVDEAYEELRAKGLKPASKPEDSPFGNREFILRDPDKNKLVFFEELK